MKNRIKINLFIAIVAVLFIGFMILSNVFVASVGMATMPGSYAEKYAKKHHLKSISVSDSQKDYFDQRYEIFDYNLENGGIMIEKYSGQSENLIIPSKIQNEIVVGIGENFFKSLSSSVKNVYLPETIIFVDGEPSDNVTIYCTDNSIFKILNGDKSWKTETRYDSEFVNFLLGDLDFDYNLHGNEIEITNYNGGYAELVVIPSYINGMPVRTVSMDLLGNGSAFVVPETVTSITGATSTIIYGFQFAIQLIFTCIAFLLSLLLINIVLGRLNNKEEYLLTGPQIVGTILYLIAQTGFCILTIYFVRVSNVVSLIISLIILVCYVAAAFLGGAGRDHSQKVAKTIEDNTSFMRNLKESTKYLADGIEDENAKKCVQEMVDEIRFSKLKSDDKKLDSQLEKELIELKEIISSKDYSEVSNKAKKIVCIIKQR